MVAVILGLFFLGVGLYLLVIAIRDVRRYLYREKREPVNGSITKSAVVPYGEGYWFEIEYEFAVSGKAYRSSRINVIHQWKAVSRSSAMDEASKFPVGEEVIVFYDRENPQDGVLTLESASFAITLCLLVSLLLTGWGVVILLKSV